jgi:hypothetical protein
MRKEAGYLAHRRWVVPVALVALLTTGIAGRIRSGVEVPRSGTAATMCAPPGLKGGVATLPATVVSDASDLAMPMRLLVHGPWGLVLDAASDSVLHLFRLNDGALRQSLGRRGRGPGEFSSAWSLSYDHPSGEAWVYDVSLARVTGIVFPDGSTGAARAHQSIQLAAPGLATGAAWLDSTRLLMPGFFGDTRLAVYDRSGLRIGGIGRRFSDRPPPYPQVSQARLALHPDGRLAVLADRFRAAIELIDLERSTTIVAQGPVPLPHRSATPGLDDVAYVDVAVSSRSIFALFSGRSYATFGRRTSFGDCVHVFGWDGTFEQAFRLDGAVIAIALSDDGSALYALRHEPRPALVRFELPAVSAARLSPPGHQVGSAPPQRLAPGRGP